MESALVEIGTREEDMPQKMRKDTYFFIFYKSSISSAIEIRATMGKNFSSSGLIVLHA